MFGLRHSALLLYTATRIATNFYDVRTGKSLENETWGTGFVVATEGDQVDMGFLVTARHVVDPAFLGPDKAHLRLESVDLHYWYQPIERPDVLPTARVVRHKSPDILYPADYDIDLAMIRRNGAEVDVLQGDDAIANYFGYHWLVKEEEYLSGHFCAGDDVLIAGFPGSSQSQVDVTRPLMVSGVLSSDPRFPYVLRQGKPSQSVLCHAFSWGGMSGGPVIGVSSVGKVRLLGVNAGHLEIAGEGTAGVLSHFVRSTVIVEMLQSQGISVESLPLP